MKKLFFVALLLATGIGSVLAQGTPAGIYVGIMSFSDDVTPLTTSDEGGNDVSFFSINEPFMGVARLKKAIDGYKVTDDKVVGGTALYYAINKALADLKNAYTGGELPKDIDSVYIITITDDGYDNASADKFRVPDAEFPEELRYSPDLRLDYSSFIKQILSDTRINDKEIQTYFLALENAEQFNSIATASSEVEQPRNLSESLEEITRRIGKENEQMIFTANFSRPRSGTRFRFQIDKTERDYWIEGTVELREGKYDITDIKSSESNTTAAKELYEKGSISLSEEGSENKYVSFNFTINGAFPEGAEGQLFRYDGAVPVPDKEAQLRVYKPVDPKEFGHRASAVVYFLLDNSKSMTEYIKEIKASLTDSIDFFTKWNDGLVTKPPASSLNTPYSITEAAPKLISREAALRQWSSFIDDDKGKRRPINGSAIRQDYVSSKSDVDWGQSVTDTKTYYYVQIGTYEVQTNAQEVYQALKRYLPDNSIILHEGRYYKVRVGPLQNAWEAEWLAEAMRQVAIDAL